MASKRSALQTKLAAAALKIVQKLDGVQVSFSHQHASANTLWARMSDVVYATDVQDGVLVEIEARDFDVPRQTNFSGTVSEGDELTYSGTVYVVKEWTAIRLKEIAADVDVDYCYRLRCSAVVARRGTP